MLERISWGCGGWADNFMFNVIGYLLMYVYVDYFRMDPVVYGLALCIPRILDAVTDLFMGNFSDNFRSRWGRRRPLIAAGAILCALLLPFWFLPAYPSTMGNPWWSNGPFYFLVLMGVMYYAIAYTMFVVPYTALGFELSDDYEERTHVLSWRMYLGLIGQMIVPWVYKLSLKKEYFPNIKIGAVVVSIIAAVCIIVLGCIPAVVCKENPKAQSQPQIPFFPALKESFSCKPYIILMLSFLLILCFSAAAGSLNGFVSLYVVCNGNGQLNAKIIGISGTLSSATSILSLIIATAVAHRFDKKWAYIWGLCIVAVAYLTFFFTLTPEHPYYQLISIFIFSLAMQGCWLMLDSMLSDICDVQAIRTGHHSEGMFSSVRSFIQKASGALMSVVAGIVLKASGFDAKVAQTVGLAPEVKANMKLLMILLPFIGAICGIVMFWFYPITRKVALQARETLNQREKNW